CIVHRLSTMKMQRSDASQSAAPPPEALAARLGALAPPGRIAILKHLSASGCCCCKDVVKSTELAQSTVSQHLKILVDAGLVRYAPDRQRSRYEVDRAAVASLSKTISGLLDSFCVQL